MEAKNIYQKLFEVKKAGITLQRDTKAFNYQYATLDQIQKKLGEVLQKQGLLVIHRVVNNEVVTEIRNTESDEVIESSIPLTEGTKAQDKGSEITYYRRYNLLSLLDLEVEDDDGKKAQDSKSNYNENKRGLKECIDDMKAATTVEDKIKFKDEAKTFAKTDKQKAWLKKDWEALG